MNLRDFSTINAARAKRWHGGAVSWSLSDWITAVVGELGEAANIVKKLNRIRDGLPGNKPHETKEYLEEQLAKELADTFTYLDLTFTAAGFSTAAEVEKTFNSISDRQGFPEHIGVQNEKEI